MNASKLDAKSLKRFMSRVETSNRSSDCWVWAGKPDNGYGRFWHNGRSKLAHKVSWEHHIGEVPLGKQLDHLCRNRACVNPSHLEPVTIGENVLRGIGKSAANARKTHCKNGHELAGANLYNSKRGSRVCGICQLERLRAWRKRVNA